MHSQALAASVLSVDVRPRLGAGAASGCARSSHYAAPHGRRQRVGGAARDGAPTSSVGRMAAGPENLP